MRRLPTLATAIVLAAPLGAFQPASQQQDPAEEASVGGRWKISTTATEGPVTSDLALWQEGARVTGSLTDQAGTKEVAGEFTDGKLVFTLTRTGADGPVEITFAGTLQEDGTLAGEMTEGDTTTAWTATRKVAPSAAGAWTMDIAGQLSAALKLSIADKAITGTFNSDMGASEVIGEVEGFDLYFGIYFESNGQGFEVWFSGELGDDGTTMRGTFDIGQGPMQWSARKSG